MSSCAGPCMCGTRRLMRPMPSGSILFWQRPCHGPKNCFGSSHRPGREAGFWHVERHLARRREAGRVPGRDGGRRRRCRRGYRRRRRLPAGELQFRGEVPALDLVDDLADLVDARGPVQLPAPSPEPVGERDQSPRRPAPCPIRGSATSSTGSRGATSSRRRACARGRARDPLKPWLQQRPLGALAVGPGPPKRRVSPRRP